MYYDVIVDLSTINGKLAFLRKEGVTYVQLEIGRVYNPKKKYNVPVRKIIGKLCKIEDETQMYPNETFFEKFPDFDNFKQNSSTKRSNVLKTGTFCVINKVVEEYGIDTKLEEHLGEDSKLVLDLASYMVINQDNAAQYYPDYAFNHPLFTADMQIFSDSTVSRLLQRTTRDQMLGFLDDWNSERDHSQRIYVSYDSTNKNCQAGDISLVEFGKAKDDKNLPIFNISIAYDKTNKVPLFYEEYSGSINDVSQLKSFIEKIESYNYKKIGFILDRGYFSKENIKYMDEKGFSFIMMAKGCKTLVSSLIESYSDTLKKDRKCHIEQAIYGMTIKRKLYDNDKERYFHIYYNPQKLQFEHLEFETKLSNMKDKLDGYIGKEIENSSKYEEFYKLHYDSNKKFLFAEEKEDVIMRRIGLCGYFCIITSEEMTAADAYYLYKGRDPSEKLFRADKSYLGSKSIRVYSNESMRTKFFIEFIALIIRNRIYNLLKDEMRRLNIRKNFMTVPAAIKELEKIEMVKRNNHIYKLDNAITKNQKIILNSFGISLDDIQKEADKISNILSNSNNTISECDAGDDYDAETEINDCLEYENYEYEI